ncbi:hypothetical protein [Actinokineospora inagensis]|uniref:hypothetical protein n=1 Tax=Actinokineospora inagensis TaxID=103730 RepID=UPI000403D00C|nr:hypothetical protein [Actinokineospora inagensis]
MCLLTFFPEGVQPDVAALARGAQANEDGHGYAIVTADRHLIVRHGMNPDALIGEFQSDRAQHPGGPALFHSRLSTGGTRGTRNCHPFPLGNDPRTVLAHNGVLPSELWPRGRDGRCDTRIAAEDFLPRQPFGSLTTRQGRTAFQRWLGASNKVVILTVNPRYRRSAYILGEDSGTWDGGIWYSNGSYQAEPDSDHPFLLDGQCTGCLELDTVDFVTGFCRVCGTCMDCEELDGHCVCYLPVGWATSSDDVGGQAWETFDQPPSLFD